MRSEKFPQKMSEDVGSEVVKAFMHSGVSGALVWDAEDVRRLRVKFRIVGGMVGALPLQPRQNCQLGLPLLLMPEEVSVLREEGVLDLRQFTAPIPSPDDIITFTEKRQTNAQQQLEAYQGRTLDSTNTSFTPLTHTLTADPRKHAQFPPEMQWTYPHTSRERRCLAVYMDLWRRGFTLTSGLKYGADYLVYSGDPALVHSHYLALVLPWQQPIKCLLSLCRVGSKVAKAVLLCSVQDNVVQYQTVQWDTGS